MLRLTTRDEFAEIVANDKKRKKFVDDLALEFHNETNQLVYGDINLVPDPDYWKNLAYIALRYLT